MEVISLCDIQFSQFIRWKARAEEKSPSTLSLEACVCVWDTQKAMQCVLHSVHLDVRKRR